MDSKEFGPISAKEFAARKGVNAPDVINQIKNGEISGFRKQSIWYVDDQALLGQVEPQPAAETPIIHSGPESNAAEPSQTPTTAMILSDADPIASALNTCGWVILGVAIIFGMIIVSNVDGYTGFGIIAAGVFQALLLMGFARIINYLKMLVDQGKR